MEADPSAVENGIAGEVDLSTINVADHIKTAHNSLLHQENQNLAKKINELVEYQLANPEIKNPSSRADIDHERDIQHEIETKKRHIRAQLAITKALYRKSVMKVREEKAATADSRGVNDTLILQLHNLKYEEQSLSSEISAAQNYDHKYKRLPFIPVEEFLELFPEHKDSSEHEIMSARIEHEYQVRVKLEERRQEKLKQKQMLIAEVKKRKDDLTKLDGMLEKFIEAAEPIQKALATEAITKSEMQVREEVEKEKKTPVERGAAGKDAGHGEGATEIKEANDAQDGVGVTG